MNHTYSGPNDIFALLTQAGAIITGSHIVLTSGYHSDSYANIRVLEGDPKAIQQLASAVWAKICEHEKDELPDNAILVGPETMGRTIATATSYLTLTNKPVPYAWCVSSSAGTSREWKLPFFAERIKDKQVYIIDDVLTTSKTLDQTIQLIRSSGAEVAGVVMIVDRSNGLTAETLGIPWLDSLLKLDMKDYPPEKCDLCEKGVTIRIDVGHGKQFLEKQAAAQTETKAQT